MYRCSSRADKYDKEGMKFRVRSIGRVGLQPPLCCPGQRLQRKSLRLVLHILVVEVGCAPHMQADIGEEFLHSLQQLSGKLEFVEKDDLARFSAAYRWAQHGLDESGPCRVLALVPGQCTGYLQVVLVWGVRFRTGEAVAVAMAQADTV